MVEFTKAEEALLRAQFENITHENWGWERFGRDYSHPNQPYEVRIIQAAWQMYRLGYKQGMEVAG